MRAAPALRRPLNAPPRRSRLRLEALIWAGVIVFIGWRIWPQVAAVFGIASANAATPPFQLTTLDARPVSDTELRGNVVLINFWATWCPPCRVEMPGFQRTYDRYRDRGFVVLGVAMDASGSAGVKQFLEERQITYPVAMATPAIVRGFGGVSFLPSSFLVDREGRIRNEVTGIFAPAALDQAVQRLLAEPVADTSRGNDR